MPRDYSIFGGGFNANNYPALGGYERWRARTPSVDDMVATLMENKIRREAAERAKAEEVRAQAEFETEQAKAQEDAAIRQLDRETQAEILKDIAKRYPETMRQDPTFIEMEEPETPIMAQIKNAETGKMEDVMLGKTKGVKMKLPITPQRDMEVPRPEILGTPILSAMQQEQLQRENLGKMVEEERQKTRAGWTTAGELRGLGIQIPESTPDDTPIPPHVAQAVAQGTFKQPTKATSPWQIVSSDKRGIWAVNKDTLEKKQLVAGTSEAGEKELQRLGPAELNKFIDMNEGYKQTLQLAELPSDPMMEAVSWLPNIARSFLAKKDGTEYTEDEIKQMLGPKGIFSEYQSYQPQYFMYAAKMLKAIQGSRPSDFDMKIYLDNLPRIGDDAVTKARKLTNLANQLRSEFNSRVEGYKMHDWDLRFDVIPELSFAEMYDRVVAAEKAEAEKMESLAAKHLGGGQ